MSEVLVCKALSVDALTSSSVATGEVSALDHELRDDSMEHTVPEVERLSCGSNATLASAESTEVLSSARDIGEQFEGDSTCGSVANADIKKDTRSHEFLPFSRQDAEQGPYRDRGEKEATMPQFSIEDPGVDLAQLAERCLRGSFQSVIKR
jgi:hypothetical protein